MSPIVVIIIRLDCKRVHYVWLSLASRSFEEAATTGVRCNPQFYLSQMTIGPRNLDSSLLLLYDRVIYRAA